MTFALPLTLAVPAALSAFWLAHSRLQRLRRPTDLRRDLRPNHISPQLQNYLDGESALSGEEFWEFSGRMDGMRDRRHNARIIVQLLQLEAEQGHIPGREAAELALKVRVISLFTIGCRGEKHLSNRLWPKSEHLCARMATLLYSHVMARATNLRFEYQIQTLDAVL